MGKERVSWGAADDIQRAESGHLPYRVWHLRKIIGGMTILVPHLPSKPPGGPTLVLVLLSDTASARVAARWGMKKGILALLWLSC
jgi:hypothetical protein